MNMLKRSLAMLLVLTLLFSFVPFSVFADDGESAETTAVTEAVEQRSGGPGNSDFGHSQGNGKDKHKDPLKETEAPEVTEAPTETTVPETTVPETTVPETTVPETTIPETTVPETTVPETTVPETTVPETTVPETTVPETEPLIRCMLSDAELNVASTDGVYTGTVEAPAEFIRVFHLDVGRRYFTVDEVKTVIDFLAANYYTHMELAIGNDGLRMLLDDMSVGTYTSEQVTAGVKAGNVAYSHDGEWTQAEMDTIIAYAAEKGIEILPLVNTPGHMDAILDAMESCGISSGSYNGSARTVDITNTAAVAFTKELVGKYMDYFASKGCTYFNIGADEYANDKYTSDSMGWGHLIDMKLYDEFINYVNELVAMACAKGLRPIAFNDGIYFNENTSFGTFDTRLIVAAWTGGWGGFDVARTSFLAGKNHQILNTNERWYYVVGRDSGGYGYANAKFYAASEKVTVVTDRESGVDSMGAMQCVWYDTPSVSYTSTEVSRIKTIIETMAASNPDYFKAPVIVEPEEPEESQPTTPSEPEPTPVVDETTNVSVTAQNVTDIEVALVTENVPDIKGASAVVAFEMTPKTEDDTAYTGEATVSIPVSAEWTNVRGGVLASDHGNEVMGIEGELKDGMFTFIVPHFSTVVAYEVAPTAEGNEVLVELTVGQTSQTYTDNSGYYTTAEGLNTAVASATLGGNAAVEGTVNYTSATVTCRNLLNDNEEYQATIYYVRADDGNHYPLYVTRTSSWYGRTYYSYTYFYSADGGNTYTQCGTQSNLTSTNTNANITVYTKTGTDPVAAQTTVSFTGVSVGETTATIGSTTYKIVVSKGNIIDTITVGDSKVYTDNSTNITVDNESIVAATPDGNGKLTITAKAAGAATVTTDNAVYTITVVEFDPATVTPLTVEYWITNIVTRTVESTTENPVTTQQISAAAAGVATAEGADINAMMPEWTIKKDGDSGEDRQVEFWHVRLLDKTQTNNSSSGKEEQTTQSADDETTNGDAVTRVRYYDPGDGNGRRWQMLSGSTWLDVNQTKNQIVAYYMEVVDIQNANGTTELHVNAADWGKLGDNSPASSYADTSKYCSISLQIVYEDGSGNPATTTAADLDSKTLIFNYWDKGRGIGTFAFDTLGQFNIYQITAETGAVDVTFTGGAWGTAQVNNFSWDNNEKVVWSGESETASIYNNTSHPSNADPKDNLMWNENKEAILIRVYVKAVKTEDSLNVVYIDEKFNDTLYSYHIQVPAEKNFTNGMIGTPGTMVNNRINVTGCGIKNVYGQTQYFQTDLTKVPEAKGKYNSKLYKYTGSEISEDGKTLYLYYNINESALSPNFVVDFGLPITFPLSDVVTNVNAVDSVGAIYARYGTLTYADDTNDRVNNGTFTYTPTKILPNIDVLSITLTITGETSTTNVGVTPATTVYYEESFLTYDSNWSVGAAPTKTQKTEVLGKSSYYGFDPAYAGTNNSEVGSNGTKAVSTANGATASFTFTGTGFELYANSLSGENASGIVTVYSQGTTEGTVSKLYMIDTALTPGDSAATNQQNGGTYYSLPIISENSLPHGTYTVQLRQTDEKEAIYIDGVRIINTIKDSSIYKDDLEDNPEFYELRNAVMADVGVDDYITEHGYIGGIEESGEEYVYLYDASGNILKNEDDSVAKFKVVETKSEEYVSGKNEPVEVTRISFENVVTHETVSSTEGKPISIGEQVYDNLNGAPAVITDETIPYGNSNAQDLLASGPKNELYLYPGQKLTFKFTTNRVAQLGLKAPVGNATFTVKETVNNEPQTLDLSSLSTTVDMFYKIAEQGAASGGMTVEIAVTKGVLSVTDLKICDDPNAGFVPLTLEDVENILGINEPDAPVEPPVPETPTEPSKPVEPTEPEKPTEPEVEETKPTKPGKPEKPEKPAKPGQNKPGKPAEKQKDAKLKITYVNLLGKKVGSATLTKTGTANQRCTFSASEIIGNAPARRNALWFLPVVVPYGGNVSIVVPVI